MDYYHYDGTIIKFVKKDGLDGLLVCTSQLRELCIFLTRSPAPRALHGPLTAQEAVQEAVY